MAYEFTTKLQGTEKQVAWAQDIRHPELEKVALIRKAAKLSSIK